MICAACQVNPSGRECFMLDGKRCSDKQKNVVTSGKIVSSPELDKPAPGDSSTRRGPRHKDAEKVKDAHSTGRKRAAVLLPLENEDGSPVICEWAGLKYAGGGPHPIIGCPGNQATNRHHGPDKDTLNNSRENPRNIHRICTNCHNRWHAANDRIYELFVQQIGGRDKLPPHNMEERATQEEIEDNERKYATNKRTKTA